MIWCHLTIKLRKYFYNDETSGAKRKREDDELMLKEDKKEEKENLIRNLKDINGKDYYRFLYRSILYN